MPEFMVVLSGAGISAESGLDTFRGQGGLWNKHRVEDVATPEAFEKNPQLVLDFYNERRKFLQEVEPNNAHLSLAALEKKYKVQIITQNVDDLHERAGSSQVLHLHGELLKVRSTLDASLIYPWKKDLKLGDVCEKGAQLRPHIVWFGEAVPLLNQAAEYCSRADILIVVGTSLSVYPAAGLSEITALGIPKYFVNPDIPAEAKGKGFTFIEAKASEGLPALVAQLMSEN